VAGLVESLQRHKYLLNQLQLKNQHYSQPQVGVSGPLLVSVTNLVVLGGSQEIDFVKGAVVHILNKLKIGLVV